MKADRHRGVMSEINVTPLVDVMLVLLIIFMITAPLLQQGLDINLPQAKGKELPPEERYEITIMKDGSLKVNKDIVSGAELRQRLASMAKQNPSVFLRADKDVPYGMVVEIMAEIKDAGIEKLGMVTEPKINVK